jgi:hypothetical protein
MPRDKRRGLIRALFRVLGVVATAYRGRVRERIGQIALDWLMDD